MRDWEGRETAHSLQLVLKQTSCFVKNAEIENFFGRAGTKQVLGLKGKETGVEEGRAREFYTSENFKSIET